MTALELSAKPQILENPKPATVGIMSEIGENPNALSRDLGVYVSKTVFDSDGTPRNVDIDYWTHRRKRKRT
jgi:hypothetical protein